MQVKIRHIALNDFQAHRKLKLKLSTGVTVLTGPTDCGKSSVVRALRWIMLNDLRGDFTYEGARTVTVRLRLNIAGTKLILSRKKGAENTYILNGKEYKAFGTAVPRDVSAVLRVEAINFQNQHDVPFWFSETAGEVSRQLNAVVDLSIIDSSLANVAKVVAKAASTVDVCRVRLKTSRIELKTMRKQRGVIKAFERVRQLHRRLKERHLKIATLEQLLTDVKTVQMRIKSVPSFAKVQAAYLRWKKSEQRLFKLSNSLSRIKKLQRIVAETESTCETSRQLFNERTKGKECPLCGNIM